MKSKIVRAACVLSLVAAPSVTWAQAAPDPNPKADALVRALQPRPNEAGQTRGIRPIGSPPAAVVRPSVSLQVDFASGSDTLRPNAVTTLDELGHALTSPKLEGDRFRIEGHTDTVGADAMNQDLSERRAHAVAEYLSQHYQIPDTRLQIVGMGKKGLAVPTGDDVAEPRNRRVAVINIGS